MADAGGRSTLVMSRRAKNFRDECRSVEARDLIEGAIEKANLPLTAIEFDKLVELARERDGTACRDLGRTSQQLAPDLHEKRGRPISEDACIHLFLLRQLVVFGCVGVERNFWAFENAQELILVAKQPSEQPIERGISGAGALEDTVETFAQELSLFRTGSKLVVLQGAIEPPDHPLGDLNGVALLVIGWNQLMDETFGMNPAQCVRADAKLTSVVGNNHGIGQ